MPDNDKKIEVKVIVYKGKRYDAKKLKQLIASYLHAGQ